MSLKTHKAKSFILIGVVITSFLFGCNNVKKSNQPVIGFLVETLKEERWQHDRDFFVAAAEKMGAKVIVQSCNGDDATQVSQTENLITQGVDLLVVVPHNGKIDATIVNEAHKNGVKVIAYDRIINDCDLDLYVSFDNEKVGELQAQYILDKAPVGNYILLGGPPTDFNAKLIRDGQLKILQPSVDAGKIKIVSDQWTIDWQPIEALKHTENALTKNNNDIAAVVASNDGTAGGAIQALEEQKLAGKVFVSGQDADLAACQRIVAGTQSMTVYKPIKQLAEAAANAAMDMIQNKPVANADKKVNNGKIDVPSILLTPISVDKSNLVSTVIKDGYHKIEDVYKDVPKDQWPQQ
jgi:D-xylose transport system substrate-binding protein